MKAKKLLLVLCTVLAMVFCFAFAACTEKDGPEPKTEYTVTFDANGGTLTGNATVKVEEGKTISGAPTAAKENHDFDAWYTQATGGDKIVLATYTVNKDVTLYAHYTEKTVTPPPASEEIKVTFDANGGIIEGETVLKVNEEGILTELPEATRSGYRFEAWYTQATGGEEVDPMFDEITEDTTLYAHWIKVYTVTFDGGAGRLEGSATVEVDENDKIVGAPVAVKDGEEFHGWYTAATDGEKVDLATYTVTKDVTLYARYGVITMPVKTLNNNEGTKVGYRIEAEEAKAVGSQNSDNSAHPGTFLEDTANASGGQSLGYLGVAGNTVTFTFKSATAGKATLSLVASSANIQMDFSSGFVMWGADQQLTGREMDMTFNGTKVNYESVLVKGATKDEAIANGGFAFNFRWTSVPVGEVDVIAGVNTFVITVADANVVNMDCLDIETTLNITSANGDAVSGEATLPAPPAPDVVLEADISAKIIVGAYDGGPAVDKVVYDFGEGVAYSQEQLDSAKFGFGWGGNMGANTDKFVISDENGNAVATGVTTSRYATITLTQSFNQYGVGNGVFAYDQTTGFNRWKDTSSVTVTMGGTLTVGQTTYNKLNATVTPNVVVPALDKWDIDGTYTKPNTEITLKYASYETDAMKNDNGRNPLIIWLHGQGEGGGSYTYTPQGSTTPVVFNNKPDVALLGNKVTALAENGIQKYFTAEGGIQGAYVLVPQSNTMWMDKTGANQRVDYAAGDVSYYLEALWELINNYVTENGDIDTNRIYIGGCSNGGFMTMQMIEHHADYFAAAFPIATPYTSSPELIEAIKDLPIWFTHSKDDTTVSIANWQSDPTQWWLPATFLGYADTNTNQIYIDLMEAGATNVYYSLFENVVGDTGAVNGKNAYGGHYSWIYVFNDECSKVQAHTGTGTDGAFTLADLDEKSTATVTLTEGGEAVTLWGWIAAQAKTPAQA